MTPIEAQIGLSEAQIAILRDYGALLARVNRKHNLVSEPATATVYDLHIRHCLSLARRAFPAGSTVVDWGTGGGLPAIPLAIAFPDVRFAGVDSVGKKVRAVRLLGSRLGLSNLEVWHGRAEEWPGAAHFAISRATAPLASLWEWTSRILQPVAVGPDDWPQGLIVLKGGRLEEEVAALRGIDSAGRTAIEPLEPVLGPEFRGKVIVHVSPGVPVRTGTSS